MLHNKKVVICFCGVFARSIKYTHFNLKKKLIDIIKKEYDVDIYIFNNEVGDCIIDGVNVKDNIDKFIEYTILEEESQSFIDKKIELEGVNTFKMRPDYSITHVNNALRHMYIEERVGTFLENNKDKYKSAILCIPDLYLLDNININDIKNCMDNNEIVYTTRVNDGIVNGNITGHTDGFYIGTLEPMIKILKRFSILKSLPSGKDYEFLLKRVFEMRNIKREITDTLFVKIGANGRVRPQGIMVNSKYREILSEIQNDITTIANII